MENRGEAGWISGYGESLSEMAMLPRHAVQTVDASGFVDLFHAINVRFTPVINVYVNLFPF